MFCHSTGQFLTALFSLIHTNPEAYLVFRMLTATKCFALAGSLCFACWIAGTLVCWTVAASALHATAASPATILTVVQLMSWSVVVYLESVYNALSLHLHFLNLPNLLGQWTPFSCYPDKKFSLHLFTRDSITCMFTTCSEYMYTSTAKSI